MKQLIIWEIGSIKIVIEIHLYSTHLSIAAIYCLWLLHQLLQPYLFSHTLAGSSLCLIVKQLYWQIFYFYFFNFPPLSLSILGPKLFVKPSSKSNRHIIINAISHCCLAGSVNTDLKNKVLEVSNQMVIFSFFFFLIC